MARITPSRAPDQSKAPGPPCALFPHEGRSSPSGRAPEPARFEQLAHRPHPKPALMTKEMRRRRMRVAIENGLNAAKKFAVQAEPLVQPIGAFPKFAALALPHGHRLKLAEQGDLFRVDERPSPPVEDGSSRAGHAPRRPAGLPGRRCRGSQFKPSFCSVLTVKARHCISSRIAGCTRVPLGPRTVTHAASAGGYHAFDARRDLRRRSGSGRDQAVACRAVPFSAPANCSPNSRPNLESAPINLCRLGYRGLHVMPAVLGLARGLSVDGASAWTNAEPGRPRPKRSRVTSTASGTMQRIAGGSLRGCAC